MRTTLALLALLALTACETPIDNPLAIGPNPPAVDPSLRAKPLYCYQTLGRVDCYETPLPPSESRRLVNHYGPPPQARGGGPARP